MKDSFAKLRRYPVVKNDPLQAWNSADELLLEQMAEYKLDQKRILIINDHFGALSSGLLDHDITVYTDSYVSYRGILLNTQEKVTPINDLNELSGSYDYVVMQIPKSLSFLEDILCHLTQHMSGGTQLICTSMVKHLAKSSFDLIEKYIGKTTTSLAKKKARLIYANFEKDAISSPYPKEVTLDGFTQNFTNHSNVFSREKLDIGTRFFLEHISTEGAELVLDLGCANGCVGIRAKQMNSEAQVIFSDESAMAIRSAKENYERFFDDEAKFTWTNCYEDGVPESVDLVLCNPPFHQNHTVGDFVAWQMFKDAKRSLKQGGKIRVIGNSHLRYQAKLKKLFGNSIVIASNKKFVIIDAVKL